eukprot:1057953-Prymnesium_polylepis.1
MPAKDANSRTSAPPRPTATLSASPLRRPFTVLTDGRRLPPSTSIKPRLPRTPSTTGHAGASPAHRFRGLSVTWRWICSC